MPKPKRLTKPIERAIGRYPLFWAYFQSNSRTVTSGFALYAETYLHENGTPVHRRLYVAPTAEDALAMNDLIMKELWDPNVRTALRINLDKVIDRWRASLERNKIR